MDNKENNVPNQNPVNQPPQGANGQQFRQPPIPPQGANGQQQFQQPPFPPQSAPQQFQQPPFPPYGVPMAPPPQQAPAAPHKPNGLSIAGLVIGLVSFIFGIVGYFTFFMAIIGIVISIVALVLSVLGYKKGQDGVNISGIVFSVLALVNNLIAFFACGLVVLLAATAAGAM